MLNEANIMSANENVQFEQDFIKNVDNSENYSTEELARMYAAFLWMDPYQEELSSVTEGGVNALKYLAECKYCSDIPF